MYDTFHKIAQKKQLRIQLCVARINYILKYIK